MLEAVLAFNSGGILTFCRIEGHAGGGEAGYNLLCAAVSVLARTAARVLENRPGVVLDGDAPEPGDLWFRLKSWDARDEGWLKGVGDYLLTGLKDLENEYSRYLKVTIRNDGEESQVF